eukprot:7812081-Alexandrium_andersonii.AAC.1
MSNRPQGEALCVPSGRPTAAWLAPPPRASNEKQQHNPGEPYSQAEMAALGTDIDATNHRRTPKG